MYPIWEKLGISEMDVKTIV